AGRVQQQPADRADAEQRRPLHGDDSQRARRADGWQSASPSSRPQLGRRSARPLGRGYARRRLDELQRQVELPRREREPAPSRTLHADRSEHARISRHARRSDDLDASVDDRVSDDANVRQDLRVRVPRGELRHAQYPRRRAPGRQEINTLASWTIVYTMVVYATYDLSHRTRARGISGRGADAGGA